MSFSGCMCAFIPATLADETDLPAPSWELRDKDKNGGREPSYTVRSLMSPSNFSSAASTSSNRGTLPNIIPDIAS